MYPPDLPAQLTSLIGRERDVEAVAASLDRGAAVRRARGFKTHLSHIYAKLGVRIRSQLAAHAAGWLAGAR